MTDPSQSGHVNINLGFPLKTVAQMHELNISQIARNALYSELQKIGVDVPKYRPRHGGPRKKPITRIDACPPEPSNVPFHSSVDEEMHRKLFPEHVVSIDDIPVFRKGI